MELMRMWTLYRIHLVGGSQTALYNTTIIMEIKSKLQENQNFFSLLV